ncbi:MAG: glutathione S-transferase, partial [Parcubacteria group bacterium]|nr:glutathione S-transferase [Parcubacteria group bacterium]
RLTVDCSTAELSRNVSQLGTVVLWHRRVGILGWNGEFGNYAHGPKDWNAKLLRVSLTLRPMLTLYYKPECPFCKKVLKAGKELDLEFNLKNIHDEGVEDELIDRGGEAQVPYLIDDEGPVEMYESDAIVKYLHHTFGKGEVESSEGDAPGNEGIAGTCTISDE